MKENTKAVGAFYVSYVRTARRHAGPPIQKSWSNEVEEPWRHGRGILIRILPTFAITLGRWHPLDPEKLAEIRQGVADPLDIESWERATLDVA
jgi:hypothetical protein